MAVKTGYYTATAAVDPQGTCTAFEAEADIASAEALGTVGEASVSPIVSSEVLSQPNRVVFKVTSDDVADPDTALSDAVTAVGSVEQASGYPTPA